MAAAKKASLDEPEIAPIEANPGHKVTTIRLTNTEYDQVSLLCQSMNNISLTDFAGRAIRQYIKACMKDPGIRKEVQRQIAKQQRVLEQFAASIMGGVDGEAE
jgi:hypothetical protein